MSLSSELRGWAVASAAAFALGSIGYRVLTLPDLAPTLDAINRPCGLQGKPCGTLADLNRTLATVRGAVGTVETAGRHYDKQLSTLDKQEAILFKDIHGTATDARGAIADVRTTVNTANSALGHVAPVLDGTKTALASVQNDTDALHTRLTDPRVDNLMDSFNSTGRNVAGMTASGAGILDDGHKLADHYEKIIDNPKLSPW